MKKYYEKFLTIIKFTYPIDFGFWWFVDFFSLQKKFNHNERERNRKKEHSIYINFLFDFISNKKKTSKKAISTHFVIFSS